MSLAVGAGVALIFDGAKKIKYININVHKLEFIEFHKLEVR